MQMMTTKIYIYGRYLKLIRGLPQTVWHCKRCRGRGCKKCNYTGKVYQESIEEIIAKGVSNMIPCGKIYFHGAGREDVDALMLGNGRPFILEICNARLANAEIEKLPLKDLEEEINKVGKDKIYVFNFRFAKKDEIPTLKKSLWNKKYRATITIEEWDGVNKEELFRAIIALTSSCIHQRTPARVSHRRADLVRQRKIYEVYINKIENNGITLEVTTEAGTYVKELFTGDNGRTTPSLSSLLGKKIEVKCLDVIKIFDNNA
jgi:tRNA pseudouridine synthase 10